MIHGANSLLVTSIRTIIEKTKINSYRIFFFLSSQLHYAYDG